MNKCLWKQYFAKKASDRASYYLQYWCKSCKKSAVANAFSDMNWTDRPWKLESTPSFLASIKDFPIKLIKIKDLILLRIDSADFNEFKLQLKILNYKLGTWKAEGPRK